MAVNIFKSTTVPTVALIRARNVSPGVDGPLPDPQTGDLWIDMSITPPQLKVLDGTLGGGAVSTPGGSSNQLQFNSGGTTFGGVIGSTIGTGGKITLQPTVASDFGVVIAPANSGTVGLLLSRPSGTADLFEAQNTTGAVVVAVNADSTTGPALKISAPVSGQIPLQAGYATGQGAGGNVVAQFLTNGTTIVSKFYVAGSGGIPTIAALTPGSTMSLSTNGTVENYIAAPAGGNELQLIVGQLATPQGMRLQNASLFGTNDALLMLSAGNNNGWGVLEANPATMAGLALSTTSGGGGPISIRPNRVETGQFPAGGGLVLFQAAPTVGASQVGYGATTATSANTGASGAPPAQVAGYLIVNIAGTARKIPFYVT